MAPGQGRQALCAPNEQSPQVGELVWPMSKKLHSWNSVNSSHDHIFYNSSVHVPVSSAPACLATSGSGHLSHDAMRMPTKLAPAESGRWPEYYEHGEQGSQHSERMFLSPESCLFILGHAEHGRGGPVRARSEQGQLGDGQLAHASIFHQACSCRLMSV